MSGIQIHWSDNAEQLPWIGEITAEEVAKHNKPDDCWIILKGEVYNITPYLPVHPSGPDCILAGAGDDITSDFMRKHKYISPNLVKKCHIGTLKK